MTKRSLGVAAVFLVGCAVGGASSQMAQVAVRPANAQHVTPLTKWEYRCMTDTWETVRIGMNGAGAQGWELVSYTYPTGLTTTATTACFKRPKL